MGDRRERNHQWFYSFNQRTMEITLRNPAVVRRELDVAADVAAGREEPLFDYDDPRYDEDQEWGPLTTAEGRNTLPCAYVVCETCDGKGRHVNPSIDSNGITSSEFDEDPDFRESYFNGDYDVPCAECKGQRVVPEIATSHCTAAEREHVERLIEEHYDEQRELEWERKHQW